MSTPWELLPLGTLVHPQAGKTAEELLEEGRALFGKDKNAEAVECYGQATPGPPVKSRLSAAWRL